MWEIYKQTGARMRQGKNKKSRGGERIGTWAKTYARTRACTLDGSPLKAGFYSFQMAVDLNATEGHSVKCNRIAPLPATEQQTTAG